VGDRKKPVSVRQAQKNGPGLAKNRLFCYATIKKTDEAARKTTKRSAKLAFHASTCSLPA
jgi:hypothetical protein